MGTTSLGLDAWLVSGKCADDLRYGVAYGWCAAGGGEQEAEQQA
jgi:hypothetical protein